MDRCCEKYIDYCSDADLGADEAFNDMMNDFDAWFNIDKNTESNQSLHCI